MKKSLSILLVLLVLLVGLTACAKANAFVGTWKGISDGEAITATFTDDNKVTVVFGENEPVNGTYEVTGQTAKITISETQTGTAEIKDNTLILIDQNDNEATMTKE